MAYKFVDADQLDADLGTVANAIRAKGEMTGKLSFPAGMAEAIGAISTGEELNFEINAYATEAELLAAAPKENTIGVITTTAISSWIFSATEPEGPEEGMLWISVGTFSVVKFNTLKKNGIMVYPLFTKQYVSGAWVEVTAKSYQNGEWTEWATYFYKRGDLCSGITGGWSAQNRKEVGETYGHSVTFNDGDIVFSSSYVDGQHGAQGAVETNNTIDISKYSKLELVYTMTQSGGVTAYFGIGTTRNSKTAEVGLIARSSEGIATIDVSNVTSNDYIFIRATAGTGNGTVTVNIKEVRGL